MVLLSVDEDLSIADRFAGTKEAHRS